MSDNQRLGRYVLERKLATGGMAEIWFARQAGPEGFAKDVVIKRILRHLGDDQKFVEMFLDEARLAAQLNHPNIVNIFDLGQADDDYFIAMEFIDGWDIEKIVGRAVEVQQPLSPAFCARLVADACAGLDYAHGFSTRDGQRVGLVHRDISPQNLLVSRDGVVKLVDFGVAKAATSSHKTQTGAVKGKLSYMSPEQISGARLDGRSDLFALGIVLYEMVTGQRPFGHESELLAVTAILNETPRLPQELHPGTPVELESIILRALAKRPEDRFQTASEMQMALEQALRQMGQIITPREVSSYLADLFSDQPQGNIIGGPSVPMLAGGAYLPGGATHEHQSPVRTTLAQPGSAQSPDADGSHPSPPPASKGGGLTTMLVLLVVALLLGGGGLALYKFVLVPSETSSSETSDENTADENTADENTADENTADAGGGTAAVNNTTDASVVDGGEAEGSGDQAGTPSVEEQDTGSDVDVDGEPDLDGGGAAETDETGVDTSETPDASNADEDVAEEDVAGENQSDDTGSGAAPVGAADTGAIDEDAAATDEEAPSGDSGDDTGATSTTAEPPPPPPAPGRVTVQIQTGGGSAQVFIDGRSVGTVRGQQGFTVQPGSHTIRVVHSSGAEQTHSVRVSAGENERLRLRF